MPEVAIVSSTLLWDTMNTTAGTLVVGGTGLHIGKLNLDGGELHVDGVIHTLLYEDQAPGGQGSFLRRLFG